MNDETKAELMKRTREWLQVCVNAATRSGVPEEADLEAFILAHIDGEPARLAAAREEQRAHDIARSRKAKYTLTGGKNSLAGAWNAGIESAIEGVMSTPLDATPLADELRTMREQVTAWRVTSKTVVDESAALRARVAELEAQLGGMTEQWKAELNHANAWMRKFRAAEAQVAAARAECARLVDRPWSRWAGDAGRDVLRAMDEATKK